MKKILLLSYLPVLMVPFGFTDNNLKKITIYGYNWKYDYLQKRGPIYDITYALIPNQENQNEYITIPPGNRSMVYTYPYNGKVRWECITEYQNVEDITWVKDGVKKNIKKIFSTHVGFCDKLCNKIEFYV